MERQRTKPISGCDMACAVEDNRNARHATLHIELDNLILHKLNDILVDE
jgi:hypothetical protein